MIKAKQILLTLVMIIIMIGVSSPLAAAKYYKVTGWKLADWQSSGDMPVQAILISQDCMVTTPGYGWYSDVVYAPEYTCLMIDEDAQQVHVHSDGEAFLYYGVDSFGKPIICYEYGLGMTGSYITLNPTPPCFDYSPSNWTLNGNGHSSVTIAGMQDLIMRAPYAQSSNNMYFVSIQLSDKWWGCYGTEAMAWMQPYYSPYHFDKEHFNLWTFCDVQQFQIVPGNYYRIKLAVNPWHSTLKLVYFPETLSWYEDQVPVMTSNTSPSGIASASSIISNNSLYAPWKAFDGNDESGSWSRWISSYDMPQWLAYQFPSNKRITAYFILPEYGSIKDRTPNSWQLQGWNGSNWVTVDYRYDMDIDVEWSSKGLVFNVQNPGYYNKYRLYVTAVNGSNVVSIRQLKLLRNGNWTVAVEEPISNPTK